MPLTELGLGGAALGHLYEAVSDAQAVATVRAALAGAVNYFDTAPFYGLGASEARLGAALAGPEVISTKVGRVFAEQSTVGPAFDYSASGVVRSIEASLTRLRRNTLDIALAAAA